MKFTLAGGHEKPQKAPATAMPEAPTIFLCDVPLIAELEVMIAAGKGWSREFEERVDQVSIALFGVTEADTHVPPPAAEAFADPRTGRVNQAALDKASSDHWDREDEMRSPSAKDKGDDEITFWWLDHYDILVLDQDGKAPLRCLPNIARQLLAASEELIDGAKLTLDGTGTRGKVSTEAWAASLAADAAKFRSTR